MQPESPQAHFDFSKIYDHHDAYKAGETIFHAGDIGNSMYILLEGSIDITLNGHSLDKLYAGTVFGEMALVDAQPRSASATAATDCKLIQIDETRFGELSSQYPDFGIEVMRIMSTRTRRLIQDEVQRQRLEEELAIGREIQLGLLPETTPTISGWDFGAYYQAAKQVGGDLYDFITGSGQTEMLHLIVADVTGKGVPAALFMATMRSVMRTLLLHESKPADILRLSNRAITQDIRSPLFLSSVCARLNVRSGEITISNAGHEWPLWIQANENRGEFVHVPGMVLGAFKEIEPKQRSIYLYPGDFLIFYTDGLTEARNEKGKLYGDDRLFEVAMAHKNGTAAEMVDALMAAVNEFTQDTPQSDDLTLVVVKRLPDEH